MNPASPSSTQVIVGHSNSFHDPSIAVAWGEEIYAEAFERHSQCKISVANFLLQYSWRSIQAALDRRKFSGVRDAEVTVISTWKTEEFLELFKDADLRQVLFEKGFGDSLYNWIQLFSMSCEPLFRTQLAWLFRDGRPRLDNYPAPGEVAYGVRPERVLSWSSKELDHHLAHAANAVYTSAFEECMVLVADGAGEGHGTSIYHFSDNRFELLFRTANLVSLGLLYSRITEFCGFDSMEGEEWKVMGLAAYGQPDEGIYQFFKTRGQAYGLGQGSSIAYEDYAELERLAGGFRHHSDPDIMKAAGLAHNFQRYFEEQLMKLVSLAASFGRSRNLAYSGGCALNSSANGKLVSLGAFDRIHIPFAPGDDGNSLGALLYEKYALRGEKRPLKLMTPYLGSEPDLEQLERILSLTGIHHVKTADREDLYGQVVPLLMDKKIIGWMQGRAELGSRALGNRSILADPRHAEMKDRINSLVKFREPYRPLAPSVLHSLADPFFENYVESPYMERTFRFRPGQERLVPAVVHQDGTGRVQSLRQEANPVFYGLIEAFYQRTGIPMLLNTSLNVMGKPIVHSVEDAITVLRSTGLDALVIDQYILFR